MTSAEPEMRPRNDFTGTPSGLTLEAASKLSELDIARLHNILKKGMSGKIAASLMTALTAGGASEPTDGAKGVVSLISPSFAVTYEPQGGWQDGKPMISVEDELIEDPTGRDTLRRTATVPIRIWLKPEHSLEGQMEALCRGDFGPVFNEVQSLLNSFAGHATRDAEGFYSPYANKCDASLILAELTDPVRSLPEGWQHSAITDEGADLQFSVDDPTRDGLGIVAWGGHGGGFLAPLTVSYNVAMGPEPSTHCSVM